LQTDGERVGIEPLAALLSEEDVRGWAELDAHFTGAERERLARAQVERDSGPAPVIHQQLESDESLDVRVPRDSFLVAVSRDLPAGDFTGGVLTAHHLAGHIQRVHGPDRAEQLHLFVTDRLGLERDRRLHGHERENLQEMILNHVPQSAGLLVVSAASAHAHRLAHGDLHVVNRVAVPQPFENRVREAEHHDILDGFLAEVMIDAKDLLLAGIA